MTITDTTVTLRIVAEAGDVPKSTNLVDAAELRKQYADVEMTCGPDEVTSLANVYATLEQPEAFTVVDVAGPVQSVNADGETVEVDSVSFWKEFAKEHGMIVETA